MILNLDITVFLIFSYIERVICVFILNMTSNKTV